MLNKHKMAYSIRFDPHPDVDVVPLLHYLPYNRQLVYKASRPAQ